MNAQLKPAGRDEYVALVLAIGDGFHPDTDGADYTSLPDGYTPEDVDRIVADEFNHNNRDPYAVANSVLDNARVDHVAARIREAFGHDLASFATDPGGFLDYSGAFRDVDHETAKYAIARVLDDLPAVVVEIAPEAELWDNLRQIAAALGASVDPHGLIDVEAAGDRVVLVDHEGDAFRVGLYERDHDLALVLIETPTPGYAVEAARVLSRPGVEVTK